MVILFAFITRKKHFLIYDIERLLFSCKNDNILWDLMDHYNLAIKKIKIVKLLCPFGKSRKVTLSIFNILKTNKQIFLKNTLLKHYKIICDTIEIKRLHLSQRIYIASQNLKDSINQFVSQFDEENQKLSSIILEKTDLIINFTQKYFDGVENESVCAFLELTMINVPAEKGFFVSLM